MSKKKSAGRKTAAAKDEGALRELLDRVDAAGEAGLLLSALGKTKMVLQVSRLLPAVA